MKTKKEFLRGPLGLHASNTALFAVTAGALLASALMASASLPASPGGQPRRAAVAASHVAPAAAIAADKGKLRILVNGQQVGSEEYEIGSSDGNWVARGTTEIRSPEGSTHVTGTLTLRPDGTPVRYEWSTQGAKKASAVVGFDGATATIELHMGNARPFTQQLTFTSLRIAVLDNNLYHQYAVLARLYDWEKKGVQNFSVLVPQELTPGTVSVESLGQEDSAGKSLDKLRVKTEDNEIDLYLDGPRLTRIAVPSANAEIVRE